jgi:hypothetical protein
MIEGSGSVYLINESGFGSGRLKKKHMDPTDPDSDPDPQHWFRGIKYLCKRDPSPFSKLLRYLSAIEQALQSVSLIQCLCIDRCLHLAAPIAF